MHIIDLLTHLVNTGASDLHIQSGRVPKLRIQGQMTNLNILPLDD